MTHGTSIIKNNVFMVIYTAKVAIILFVSIYMFKAVGSYQAFLHIIKSKSFYLYAAFFFTCFTGVIYLMWINRGKSVIRQEVKSNILWLVETIFFLSIILPAMHLSISEESEIKYIFLILIIISVIQYGMYKGLITTFFSSVIILVFDLMYEPTVKGINSQFNKDLIIVSIFIFVAWVLGQYVDIESQNNKSKDKKLKSLANKLKKYKKNREHIEEMLLKNDMCFSMLFENSQNAIIVHDNGKIIYANESAAKLLGYENPMDLSEKLLYNHYRENQTEILRYKYSIIIKDKVSKLTEEESIINCSGQSISVRNTSSYLLYDGKPTILTFLLDITSEKQIEILKKDVNDNIRLLNETREYNALITDFFINISHELKTPINVIYAAIQTTATYLDNYDCNNIDKCMYYLKMMKQNCYRLMRLINNLLDATKLDSGFIKLDAQNDNIVSVIEDITMSVAFYIKSKNINLIFDTNIEEKIMAFDHDKMERIMLNLLSNACKYTEAGGQIYVNLEDRGSSFIIKIKDNGQGIPKDKLELIFERFGQANRALSRENEGSGIGLYLVKSFVELHSGKISVSSVEGEGSEFVIEIPVILLEEEKYDYMPVYESNVERINLEFSDIYSIYNNK